jgi:hypothetical protein
MKVVIAGCTKNSASYLRSRLETLTSIGNLFETSQILIYENDSDDNTVAILTEFKSTHSNFTFIHEHYVDNKTNSLAHGRNMLLYEISQNYNDYDYMIMVDLDVVLDKFNPTQILHMFSYTNWDVLTANCNYKYYDIWALRMSTSKWTDFHAKIWPSPLLHDCWRDVNPRECIRKYQQEIPMNYPLLEVDSAFNGLGIYKLSAIVGCRYSPEQIQCEHVSFHRDIVRKGGKIYICPSILVTCEREHIVELYLPSKKATTLNN